MNQMSCLRVFVAGHGSNSITSPLCKMKQIVVDHCELNIHPDLHEIGLSCLRPFKNYILLSTERKQLLFRIIFDIFFFFTKLVAKKISSVRFLLGLINIYIYIYIYYYFIIILLLLLFIYLFIFYFFIFLFYYYFFLFFLFFFLLLLIFFIFFLNSF